MSFAAKVGGFNNHLLYVGHTVWENNLTSLEDKENTRSQLYVFKCGSTSPLPSLLFSIFNVFFPSNPSNSDLSLHFALTSLRTPNHDAL